MGAVQEKVDSKNASTETMFNREMQEKPRSVRTSMEQINILLNASVVIYNKWKTLSKKDNIHSFIFPTKIPHNTG